MDEAISAVREFNRFYTRTIGVLREGLLDSEYTLTEARVLFELARRGAVEVAGLRRDLALDAGYLSRILGLFEARGLVRRSRSTADARRQVAELTAAGRSVAAELDRRSASEVANLLDPVAEPDRRRLLAAMATIREVFGGAAALRPPLVLRTPVPGDLGWVVQRHGELYAREHGWDETYEALVARVVADYATGHTPGREAAWIAEIGGERVGSVLCARRDEETAQLRVLLVEPTARGAGVGTRLVEECLRFAGRAGYRRVTLWTYDVLAAARRIYQRAGFTLDTERAVRAHGHDLVEQFWSRTL